MTIFSRLFGRQRRAKDLSWEAMRGQIDFAAALSRGGRLDGVYDRRPVITPAMAETNATVLACINVIAGSISSFPANVYKATPKGREVAPDHALARLIREGANRYQNWPDFIRWAVAQTLLWGNALAEIKTSRDGAIAALEPIPWPFVTPLLLPSGRVAFDIQPSAPGGHGAARRLLDSEVLHLKDRGDDGLIGRSRIARCSPPVRAALTQAAFNELVYENGAAPSGVLSLNAPGGPAWNSDQKQQLRANIQENWSGARNAGKMLIIDQDAKYTPVSQTPENLEMNAAQRFATEEIARVFGVPLPLINIWDHSSFTNSETAGRWFANFTLAPIIRTIEADFCRAVFAAADRDSHCLEFDMSALLRGDAEARWKAHEIAVRNKILTPNEIREVEGWNPRDDLEPLAPEGAGDEA